MFWQHDPEVLIVGAGPVGLTTALLLAERGVQVEVIDEAPGPDRTTAPALLHPASLALLDDLGVAGDLLEQGVRIDAVAFYDGPRRRTSASLQAMGGEFPFLLALPRGALDAVLERRLAARHVKVQWSQRLEALKNDEGHVDATVQVLGIDSGGYGIPRLIYMVEKERHVPARFLIGADGFHSMVRRSLHIDLEPSAPAGYYADVLVHSPAALGPELRVALDAHDTSVVWPLPENRYRWLLELHREGHDGDGVEAELLGERIGPDLDFELIERLLQQRAPWFEVGAIEHAFSLRFAPGLARRFGEGGAWLLGDAAHVGPPMIAMGMNVGLSEAHDLASRIARILRSEADLGALQSYQLERARAWRELLAPTLQGAASPWVAENAVRLSWCLPADAQALLGGQLDFGEAASSGTYPA